MEIYSLGFGGQKPKIKVLAVLVPCGGARGESVPFLSPSFWWWRAIVGIPWLVDTSFQSLPLSSQGFACVLSLCVLSFYCKDTGHWISQP